MTYQNYMSQGGVIENVDANQQSELASDWAYQEEIVLYNLEVRFRDELIDPSEHIGTSRTFDPIISFGDVRNKEVLVTDMVGKNAFSLKDEVTFNTAYYKDNKSDKRNRFTGTGINLMAHE